MNHAYVTEICRYFYPDNVPTQITPEIEEIAAAMLHAAMEKSKVLDLVPRPSGARPGPLWLYSQAVFMFWRNQRRQRIYEAARRAVAVQWKTRYEEALQGF